MTRVDAIYSQVMELTVAERQELFERMAHRFEEDDGDVDQAIMKELYRRLEEFESGAAEGIPAEEVFRQLEADLEERRQAR